MQPMTGKSNMSFILLSHPFRINDPDFHHKSKPRKDKLPLEMDPLNQEYFAHLSFHVMVFIH